MNKRQHKKLAKKLMYAVGELWFDDFGKPSISLHKEIFKKDKNA